MSRLSRYLTRQYLTQAVSLAAAIIFLVWIGQALKLFDVITSKGQSVLTLIGQAFLSTPPLTRMMLYICFGIGIARALDSLQSSHELHSIHATRRVGTLWSSLFVTATIGAILVGLIAHWFEPSSYRAYRNWTEQVAADMVGRTLKPHEFREVAPDFVVEIGGRLPDGTITDFFADDSRDPKGHRTYEARFATINSDEQGLYLSLSDGRMQYQNAPASLTEVGFASYQIGLESLTQKSEGHNDIGETTTYDLYLTAQHRKLTPDEVGRIEERWMEIPRMYVMCLLVAILRAFPRGSRKAAPVPLEIVIVIIAMIDRVVTDQILLFGISGLSGVVMLAFMAFASGIWRVLDRRLPRFGNRPA